MTKMKVTWDSERALFLIRDAMSDDEIDYIISKWIPTYPHKPWLLRFSDSLIPSLHWGNYECLA